VISERNGKYFEAEADKWDSWADDLKVALEREIKEMDRQIREARRKASQAASLETKLAGQKQIPLEWNHSGSIMVAHADTDTQEHPGRPARAPEGERAAQSP
jgi:hypothetical protein